MIDELQGISFPNINGYIYYSYDSMAQIIPGLIVILLTFLTFWIFLSMIQNRKTYNYRKELMDLYVAGTIRKLADKDNINLDEEYKEFLRTGRRRKSQEKELDDTIENELKEKVIEENDKAYLKK